MYLFTELRMIPLILMFILWGVGGWLMTVRWFDLESHERGFIGLGLGLIVSNFFGNFLARLLPMSIAFWAGGLLTLAIGLASAWPLKREWLSPSVKIQWSKWILLFGAVLIFTLIGRGLGMLDEYQNLPTESIMATGDIPPHLPGSPAVRYGYHYFLILIGVQLTRVAGAAPWTALDLARGLTLALAIALTAVLAYRLTRNKTVAYLSGIFFALAGGTRWLLLLLPASLLNRVSAALTLIGSGQDTASNLVAALALPWRVEGSGPIPFPFAFVNGVNTPSIMNHNGFGVSAGLVMLVLLLLADRYKTRWAGIPLVVLLASLALANEVDFTVLYLGIILVAVIWVIENKGIHSTPSIWFWIIVAVSAGLVAAVQGGMITETLRGRLVPSTAAANTYFKVGFGFVPPEVISSHLGRLSLFNPYQFLAAVFEVGPLVLALPFVLQWGYQAMREERWMHAALAAATVPSLFSIFVEYSGNAGITATTRLLSNLFFMCKILAVPLVWSWLKHQTEWKQQVTYALGGMTILGGLVLFSIELIAIPHPVYVDFVTDMDAQFYNQYWNRLPASAWVFDPETVRSMTVFGRQADSFSNWRVNTPEYVIFIENPDPASLHAAGYSYIYAGKDYWKQHADLLGQACVKTVHTIEGVSLSHGVYIPDYRRLVDISGCR